MVKGSRRSIQLQTNPCVIQSWTYFLLSTWNLFSDSCHITNVLVTTPMGLDLQPVALSMRSMHYLLGFSGTQYGECFHVEMQCTVLNYR